MTAQELANLGTCDAGAALGFNTDTGCADLLEAAEAIWLLAPSLRISPTQEINAAYIKTLQMAGQLVIIKGINTFTENGNDDAIETLEDDTQILTNKGKYKFMATFANYGLYFNRALTSIEGKGGWRTAIVDKKGDVFLTRNDDLETFGFTTGMIRQTKLQVATNTVGTKSGFEFQMLNRYELDEYYVRWANENLDFDPRLVEPVTQVWLSLVNAPADTDTVTTVKAVADRGRKVAITGINFDQFLNTIDGATENPTADDDEATGDGIYVLTNASAVSSNEVGALRLYDNANNSPIVDVGGVLYKSNTVAYTVT